MDGSLRNSRARDGPSSSQGHRPSLNPPQSELGHRIDNSGLDRSTAAESKNGDAVTPTRRKTEPARPERVVDGNGAGSGSFRGGQLRTGGDERKKSTGTKSAVRDCTTIAGCESREDGCFGSGGRDDEEDS